MSKKAYLGKNTKVGCLVIIVVILVLMSSGILSAINIEGITYEALIKKLGFSSTAEFEEFSEKLNAEFDASLILVNVPTSEDAQNVKDILSIVATLKNSGESIFDADGNLKLEQADEQGILLSDDLDFSDKEFASFLNLFIKSLDKEDGEYTDYVNLLQVNYQKIDSTNATFNFFVDLNVSNLKQRLSKFSDIIPNKILFNIGFDLNIAGEKPTINNASLKINLLDTATNERFIEVLSIILGKTNQEVIDDFASLAKDFIYEVFAVMDCKMQLNDAIIGVIRN